MNFKIEKGDLTTYNVDAIVNAANTSLLGGGGVDGAIHKKAGPELLKECKKLNGCMPGQSKITPGYKLPTKYIIHTVGPQILGINGPSDSDLKELYNAWYNSLKLADENKIKTIAFPSISTGCYSFPLKLAPSIVGKAIHDYQKINKNIETIILVCYDEYTMSFYEDWFFKTRNITELPALYDFDEKITRLKQMILKANNIVFIGGAGLSTESGIPDFRGAAGLYVKENNYRYKPRTMLSKGFFYTHCKDFYEFYKNLYPAFEIKPNLAHYALVELEKSKGLTIITQNIDGLHEKAGSNNVINLHGTAVKNHCMFCRREYGQEEMELFLNNTSNGIPKCPICKIGTVRPNVVLYDEMIPITPLLKAKKAIKEADLIIVGGTTLLVNPTKTMISKYNGPLVVINQGETTADEKAELIFNESVGNVLNRIV
ncbi:NAD-dependent protein deacylase [Lacrimispora amygdalina]|uniref:NAD-dependent protein deacylase n=1 Tax=Lacrimispora amygdalina TaxID=253257 RepID=UPI000BE40FA7|nr:NAD-dependent protein deacylase [Lacrimispora amygdalina]